MEEEFLIFTEAGEEVVAQGQAVVADAQQGAPRAAQVDEELKQEQAETGSAPVQTFDELRQQLVLSRRNLATATARRGLLVAAMGTSPLIGSTTETGKDRYRRMLSRFGLVASEQLTCGQHVHVSVSTRHEGVTVIDRLQPWLPIVRALSANSPYWQGKDTSYSSYRTIRWGQWPTAGPTEAFQDLDTYEQLVADLIETGAALDEGMIYFDCRLSSRYPTVEIRVADVCTDVDDAVLLAVICRALVESVAVQSSDVAVQARRSIAVLRAAHWRAARYGLGDALLGAEGLLAAPVAVGELFEFIRPALAGTDEERFVSGGLERLLSAGSGSEKLRAAFAQTGELRDVVVDASRRTALG